MGKVLVINGPNLNLLGERETEIYGSKTLPEIEQLTRTAAKNLGLEVDFFQSNHEGEIIDKIHEARRVFDAIIINPGAFTHYSIAIRDALKGVSIPAIEVHMSNIHNREDFRSKSVISPSCVGQISGFGYKSYITAITAAALLINDD